MDDQEINYCLRCGTQLILAERYGRQRKTCPACDWVYFADPKVAVATLIVQDGKVLLVRRGINPNRGMWTLPAGFVDAGEDPVHAAERECLEEAGIQVKVSGLITVLFGQEHPRGAHIIIFYQADIVSGQLTPGDDVDQVAFFARSNLPPLAFQSTYQVLNILS
jgi:ADP-ribose pyrophosphatase YjhB (NUDIX family)